MMTNEITLRMGDRLVLTELLLPAKSGMIHDERQAG
jgi:hypothetical protein